MEGACQFDVPRLQLSGWKQEIQGKQVEHQLRSYRKNRDNVSKMFQIMWIQNFTS